VEKMLDEIKSEVKHVMKDYYEGVPVLSLKQIQWLIEQIEQIQDEADKIILEKTDIINSLQEELAKQKELTELWKERYLDENEKLVKIVREG
jgi:hypothetical protein